MNVILCGHLDKQADVHRLTGDEELTVCGVWIGAHVVIVTKRGLTCDVCKLGTLTPADVTGVVTGAPTELVPA